MVVDGGGGGRRISNIQKKTLLKFTMPTLFFNFFFSSTFLPSMIYNSMYTGLPYMSWNSEALKKTFTLNTYHYYYLPISDRVRAARCAFSHIKLKKRALFSGQMREFRIYYF